MEAFVSRKRRRISPLSVGRELQGADAFDGGVDNDSTEVKMATLASLYSDISQEIILDCLISSEGSILAASRLLDSLSPPPSKRISGSRVADRQGSLLDYGPARTELTSLMKAKPSHLTRKGQTLHLYTPEDIALHTPCSIIHNFLPPKVAEDLLRELLEEAPSWERQTFKLFDNVVESPHSACFYVQSLEEQQKQSTEYLYNGSYLTVCTLRSL